MSRPRGERSGSSSPTGSSRPPGWGRKRDALFSRFTATIPLQRLVRVTWGSLRRTDDDYAVSVGVPHLNLDQVLYLMTPGRLIGIPKALVMNIEGVTTPKPVEPAAIEPGQLEAAPGALDAADPAFQRFYTAILLEERVRIAYSEIVRDPTIEGDETVRDGVRCATIGHARYIDDQCICVGDRPPLTDWIVTIPRCRVLRMDFMGAASD